MKLLIVDDEKNIREVLREYAKFEGYEVELAVDGFDAINKASEDDYDLIVMDVMMPRLDGFSSVKRIKEIKKDVKVLMLSARGEEYDKLFGFEVGIDDYVVKPFSPKEVMARIKAILRRNESEKRLYEFGSLKVDDSARNVYVSEEKLSLTPKEYELLLFLIKNKGNAVSREKILTEVWNYDFYGGDRTIDTHIKMLRNNLKDCKKYIQTIRGIGYKFEEN